MNLIKVLLTCLISVSLCLANISGKVTDTSGVSPIAGAVVQLENGGQKDTTKADGSFTLLISTGILPDNDKLLQNSLSARISGDMMTVSMPDKSAVEIAVYDFRGKSLFSMRKTLEAGSQNIALPQQGAGVYLYKVKAGNREFVLKGNIVGGVTYGSFAMAQGSAKSLAKQAKTTATISDIIAATKDGELSYRCVIRNNDTSGVIIKMIANAGNVTDVDGNVYQTVKIGNQVWTVENLRTTKYNNGSAIPYVPNDTSWNNLTSPGYCYFNNTIDSDFTNKYGALYNWYAVNSMKLAPIGWHVPSDSEWTILENYLNDNGYNWNETTVGKKIAKSLASKIDWTETATIGSIGNGLSQNNKSGFAALPGGCRLYISPSKYENSSMFYGIHDYGVWWSSTENTGMTGANGFDRDLYCDFDSLYSGGNLSKSNGYSVRLVKDN